MGKKIWLSMHPKNFGSENWSSVRCPPLHVSWGEILHFKYPRLLALKRWEPPGISEIKNNTNKADSFFRLNFNVCIDVDNREWARVRDKKQRRPMTLEGLHGNFMAVVWKWEMLAATKMKMSGSEKIANRNTFNISSIKRVTREFLEVSRFSRAK